MAEATTTNTTKTAPAKRSTTRKPAASRTRASTRATTRSTAAKAPSKTTGRRTRTAAKNRTREAAKANTTAAKTTAAQGRGFAERAALVYVGATLEARDRVLGVAGDIVGRYGTRAAAEREVNKDLKRFERRGNTARNNLERDVRKARTRLERAVRTRRREAERVATQRTNIVSKRVEDAAQVGIATGNRIATVAKERVT